MPAKPSFGMRTTNISRLILLPSLLMWKAIATVFIVYYLQLFCWFSFLFPWLDRQTNLAPNLNRANFLCLATVLRYHATAIGHGGMWWTEGCYSQLAIPSGLKTQYTFSVNLPQKGLTHNKTFSCWQCGKSITSFKDVIFNTWKWDIYLLIK